ncbi:MAG: AAA domain-containing protein, partial [Candidatus Kapaibacteriales bacterium]
YRKLLYHFISFVFKEHKLAKTSDNDYFNSKYSQKNLWNCSIEEKIENQIVLSDLYLIIEKSDFKKFYLTFRRIEQTPQITSLRKGDPIVLYHPSSLNDNLAGLIFKGVIKTLDFNEVTISLRNKLSSNSLFKNIKGWIIEPDVLDTTFRHLIGSLSRIAYLPEEKIDYLLAEKLPFKLEAENICFPNVEETYSKILNEAVAFFPYYIIKGPPGTGKTRIVIKNLIEYYFGQSSVNLLVIAYTNRAVDEIADVLIQSGLGEDFIRLGTKESSDFSENLIANIVEKHSINKVEEKIKNCRIFLSTVSSALTNQGIFELKNFQVAIVDEASQILFPHLIGILAKVDKFILIGDEKQLSSVVLQEDYLVSDDEIKELGFENLYMSYFEFLVRKLTRKTFSNCIAMLNSQARMHPSILQIVNELFYENKVLNHTKNNCEIFVEQCVRRFLSKIEGDVSSRVIFINCPIDPMRKVNRFQAELVSMLLDYFISEFASNLNVNHLGVVSPYRLQNAEIFNRVSRKAKDFVTIDTVERFQGAERNIIFLSLPFNNLQQIRLSQSILIDTNNHTVDRKLNVAISRAKDLLIILGNKELLKGNMVYNRFVEYLEKNAKIFDYYSIKKIFEYESSSEIN